MSGQSVTVIIQSRVQSKRLPGKSIKLLAGKPLVTHVIERARLMRGVGTVVVATCPGNDDLAVIAREAGAQVFVGSEENVLERYTLAAREYGGDYIARITGDNPFTDVEYGSIAIEKAISKQADLSSLTGLPLGIGIELIKREALERAYSDSTTDYHREHVSPYIKEHPELFTIVRTPSEFDNPYPDLRLTVDTEQDFMLASIINAELYRGVPFSIGELVDFIRKTPSLIDINRGIEQRPMTHSESRS